MIRVVILALTLAGCAISPVKRVDFLGHTYPDECMMDLSHIETPIYYVSKANLQTMAVRDGLTMYGAYYAEMIFVRDDLRGWVRDEVIHHERCHAKIGHWHD